MFTQFSTILVGLATLIGALAPTYAKADYKPTYLFQLAATADFIATGEIVELREKTYILKVEDVLVGKRQKSVEVARFVDWVCASRWSGYDVGERILLFAQVRDGKLHSMGAACEGESPLVGKSVFCRFPCWLEPREKVGKYTMSKVPLNDIRDAILEYRTCFRFVKSTVGSADINRIDALLSDRALKGFAERSKVHEFLIESTRQEQVRLFDSPGK